MFCVQDFSGGGVKILASEGPEGSGILKYKSHCIEKGPFVISNVRRACEIINAKSLKNKNVDFPSYWHNLQRQGAVIKSLPPIFSTIYI